MQHQLYMWYNFNVIYLNTEKIRIILLTIDKRNVMII